MKIDYIYSKGIAEINEDNLLVGKNIFGVFDGATSLNKYKDKNGNTGGYIASLTAKEVFESGNKPLRKLAIDANFAVKDKMVSAGVDISKKINLWSVSAAAVKINANDFEWTQIGDSLILIIYNDNTYELLVEDYDVDKNVLIKWKELVGQKVENIWEVIMGDIIKLRETANIAYGIINGERKMEKFLKSGKKKINKVKHIIIFTDGLIIPKKDPGKKDDFDAFVELFLEGGLEKIKNYVRETEKEDPNCWIYPRYKQHDDIAAISISF